MLYFALCLVPYRSGKAQGTPATGQGAAAPSFLRMPERPFSLLRNVGFRDWQADLEFGYEWDRQDASATGQPRTRYERANYTERVHLSNAGFIVDPRLISFGLGTSLGLYQAESSAAGQNSGSNGSVIGYSASATLFPEKPYTLNAFGNRSEDVLTREFAGASKLLMESYGSSVTLREVPLESVLGFRREHVRQELTGLDASRRDETRNAAFYQGTHLGEVSDLNLNYEFDDSQETPSSFNLQTHDGGATYRYFFGPYLEKDSFSRVHVFKRLGQFDSLLAQAGEDLRVDHTDTLTSVYDYAFLLSEAGHAQTLTHTGSAGLQHRLFGSLRSDLRATGNYSDFQTGQTFGYGGTLGLNYTKRLPFEGRLSAGGTGAYRIDNQKLPTGEQLVPQEQHTVENFQLIFLNNPRVVQDTVVVANDSGVIVYEPGFDYTLVQFGDLTAIERLPAGHLQDNQVILVDYRVATPRDLDFSTVSHGFNVDVDYRWVSLFFRRGESDQNQLGGQNATALDETFLDHVTDQTAGARLAWERTLAQASLLGDYHSYRSRRVAFNSPRLLQSFSLLPRRTLSVTATASESFFSFSRPQDRRTTNLMARLSANWSPMPTLSTEFFTSYLQLNDTIAPDERLLDTGVRLQFVYGKLRVAPTISFARRESGHTETTEVRATVWVTRTLF